VGDSHQAVIRSVAVCCDVANRKLPDKQRSQIALLLRCHELLFEQNSSFLLLWTVDEGMRQFTLELTFYYADVVFELLRISGGGEE
jgi:hypothetical protein